MIEKHFSHDLGLLHGGEEEKVPGFAEVETLTDPVHVGGVAILCDRDHDERAILIAYVPDGEEVVIAEKGALETQNDDILLDRGNGTVIWTVQEMGSVDEVEETANQQKVICGVERLSHVVESDVGFDSCDHAHHDDLCVDP